MTNGRPSRIKDEMEFWTQPPAELSKRCLYWIEQIHKGWRPNGRVATLGYHGCAEFFGVYIWEYLNVLSPLIWSGLSDDKMQRVNGEVCCSACHLPYRKHPDSEHRYADAPFLKYGCGGILLKL